METPVISTSTIGGKTGFAVRAKAKVWADADNNLVADEDPKAAILVAKEGELTTLHRIQKHPNYRDHFDPVNNADSFPAVDDAEEKELQEATKPKRGRPPKVQTASEL